MSENYITKTIKIEGISLLDTENIDIKECDEDFPYKNNVGEYMNVSFANYSSNPKHALGTSRISFGTTVSSNHMELKSVLWMNSNTLNIGTTLSDISCYEAKYQLATKQLIDAYKKGDHTILRLVEVDDIENWVYLARMYGYNF